MSMVQRGQIKKKGKGKTKAKPMGPKPSGRDPKFPYTPKANQPKLKESESTCFHCNQSGHWRRNCKLYREEQRKNRTKVSRSGIMLLNNMSISATLVFNTSCGCSNICFSNV